MNILIHVLATFITLIIFRFYNPFNFGMSFQSLLLAVIFGIFIDLDHVLAYWIFKKGSFTLDFFKIRRWFLKKRRMFVFHFLHAPIVAIIVSIFMLKINEPLVLIVYFVHLFLDQIYVLTWREES